MTDANPFDQFDNAAQPAPSDANPFDDIGTTAPASAAAPDGAAPQADAAPVPGFTDEQMQAIRGYLPKAKDAADLERFSLELSGGKKKIGNAQEVLDKLKKGAEPTAFAFSPATVDKSMAAPAQTDPLTMDHVRTTVRDALMNLIAPGLGHELGVAVEPTAKPFLEHVANASAFDYGPEVGGVIDTLLHPDQYGDFGANLDRNTAHERATMEGDSEGHPVASITGELTGAGLTAATGNEAGLADAARGVKVAARGVKVAAGTAGGAAFGSGAAGPGDRVAGGVTGAAIGSASEIAAPFVAKFIAATKAGDSAAAAAVAKAAHDLGIDLPRFVIGGTKDARKAAALEQTAMGSGPIVSATNKMIDQSAAARQQVADSLGSAATTDAQLGDDALNAAVGQNKKLRAAGGTLYRAAEAATADTTIAPTQTLSTIDGLLAEENGKIGGSKIAPILQRYRDDLAKSGEITVQQARDLRTDLREQLSTDAGATPDKTDRIVNMVMSGVNEDMAKGLSAAGKPDAAALYKEADANWAQQRQLEDEVLKPFLGKNFDNWGEDVAKRIFADAKGNGTRLARFLNALPEDDANRVRATLVTRLGTSREAAQNAAGDAFSLDTFLTNWNQMKGARNLVFPKETVQALDKLAQVADVAKNFGRKMNRSNTGGVMAYLTHGVPTALGTGGAIFTHDPKLLGYGLLVSAMSSLRQRGAAKLLASPAFAKKLAATPMSGAGAKAFWSRPWVQSLAAGNPSIAGEIMAFQKAFLTHANDNALSTSGAVAQPQEENQQ